MIKHPNANGMQLDINTANIIPARFVKAVTVKRDGELVFQMDSTFSISTNPNFRFTFGRGPTTISTWSSPTPTRRGSRRSRSRVALRLSVLADICLLRHINKLSGLKAKSWRGQKGFTGQSM